MEQDSAVVQDRDEEGKIVYLFLPLYKVRALHGRVEVKHLIVVNE